MPTPDHTAAISAVVQTYIEGMVFGDRAKIEAAFHENAGEVGHFDGDLAWASRAEMIAEFESAADPGATPVWDIRSINIAGDIAQVHVTDDWAGMSFDDFLTLLNHDGRWVIVSKAYYVRT